MKIGISGFVIVELKIYLIKVLIVDVTIIIKLREIQVDLDSKF